jgi:hypothetical protein
MESEALLLTSQAVVTAPCVGAVELCTYFLRSTAVKVIRFMGQIPF